MSVFILNFDYWRFHLQNRTPQLVHLLCPLIEPISVRPEFSLFCFSVKLIRIQWTRMNPCALCFITKKPLLVVHCIQYWNHLFLFIYISNYWLICEPLVLSVSYLQCHASYSRLPTVFLHSLFSLPWTVLLEADPWGLHHLGSVFSGFSWVLAMGSTGRRWWAEEEAPSGRHSFSMPSWLQL